MPLPKALKKPSRVCPRCSFGLSRYTREQVELDHCKRCGGLFLDLSQSQEQVSPVGDWKSLPTTRSLGASPRLRCPLDGQQMQSYEVSWSGQKVVIDESQSGQGLWLDRGELQALQTVMKQAKRDMAPDGPSEPGEGDDDGSGILYYIFQVLTGFPVEVWNPVKRRPVVVYSFIGVLALFFFLQLLLEQRMAAAYVQKVLYTFGLRPKSLLGGEQSFVVLLTYAFLHGGWMHLIGNLYFLHTFGDNVEDFLGRGRFLLVYLLSALAGAALHIVVYSGASIPMIGASGAISGLMGAYLVLFPRVKIWYVFFYIRFRLGVIWYLLIWIGLQVVQLIRAGDQVVGVAWFAHFGGFAAGLILAFLFRSFAVPYQKEDEAPVAV